MNKFKPLRLFDRTVSQLDDLIGVRRSTYLGLDHGWGATVVDLSYIKDDYVINFLDAPNDIPRLFQ